MATSSILTNFTITEKNAAERFADALEAASKQPTRKPTAPVNKPLREPDAIRALMAKRKENYGKV